MFLTQENKIHIFKPLCNFFFIIILDKLTVCTSNWEKVGNDVIDIFTSKDMENIPLESQMLCRMNFMRYIPGLNSCVYIIKSIIFFNFT